MAHLMSVPTKLPARQRPLWTPVAKAMLGEWDAGIQENSSTYASVLRRCGNARALLEGKRLHAELVRRGQDRETFLGNLLVEMYGKCGAVEDARGVFEKLDRRNVFSWTVMIGVYVHHGYGKEALLLFRQIREGDVILDKAIFVSVLSACADPACLAEGKRIHSLIVDSGFESDVIVGTALVNMYGKCDSLEDARKMFDTLPRRNVVSWTAMIAAYAQHEHGIEALQLFQQMEKAGVIPDKPAFLSILSACASQAALTEGKQIHARIVAIRLESDIVLGTALVNMYGKCGSLEDARMTFDNMPERNVVSWNAMLAVYAQHGHVGEVLQLFRRMLLEGENADKLTFVSVLSACSHAGLVDEGRCFFFSMSRDHAVSPTLEHYHCMIDLLGRAGRLEEGEELIITMPYEPVAITWITLLGACRMHFDVERGTRVAERVFGLDPDNAAPYVLLSNIYAATGNLEDAANIRKIMWNKGLKKQLGCSCIEVKNRVREFFVEDEIHPQKGEIYDELQRLSRRMEEAGYVTETKVVPCNVEEKENEHMLCQHR